MSNFILQLTIVYCSYAIVNEDGQKKCEDFIVPETTGFEASLVQSVISCSTALLSRNIVEIYRFNDAYYHEDLVLWLQILKDGFSACGVVNVLAEYRVMGGTRASNKLKVAVHRWRTYHEFLGFSLYKSTKFMLRYALLGLKKYRRRTNNTRG